MLAPNGTGMHPQNRTIASSSNFGDRATNKTLREMTNPFLSRAYNQGVYDASSNDVNSNLYSYHASNKTGKYTN